MKKLMLSWFVVISSHPSGSHLLNPPLQHEDGSALLSKRIKIWWENDQEWYSGTVEKFDSQSGKHTIAYDDGEKELLDLEEEKVSPFISAPSDDLPQYMLIQEPEERGTKRLSEVAKVILESDDDDDEPIRSKRGLSLLCSPLPLPLLLILQS
jgi:hypothetical protein